MKINMLGNLTWKEIVEYIKANGKLNSKWHINNKIDLKTKFYAIDALNTYIGILAQDETEPFDTNFYEIEICKRMMSIGLYLDIIPAVTDCKQEYYEYLAETNIFNEILDGIQKEDYQDFQSLINRYVDVNTGKLMQVLNEAMAEFNNYNETEDLTELLAENEDTIKRISDIINFNLPNQQKVETKE